MSSSKKTLEEGDSIEFNFERKGKEDLKMTGEITEVLDNNTYMVKFEEYDHPQFCEGENLTKQ